MHSVESNTCTFFETTYTYVTTFSLLYALRPVLYDI